MAEHDGQHDHHPARPWVRLRHLLAPERRDITAVVWFAGATAVLSLATPIAVEALVNTVAFGVLLWPIVVIALVLTACLGLAAAIRAMQVYIVEVLQRRLFVRVVADYSRRLPAARLDAFDRLHGPDLMNRFFDVLNVQKSLAFFLLDVVSVVVTSTVGMLVLAFYSPFLVGFDLALVVLIAFAVFVLGWGGVSTSLHESHAKYEVAGWLEELARAPRLFKPPAPAAFAAGRADALAGQYVAARAAHFRVVWRQTLFALALQVFASAGLLGLGGWLVVTRGLTLGQLVAAELIVTLVVASVAKLGKYAETYYDLMAGAEKLGVVTDLPAERQGGEALADPGRPMAVRVRGVDRVSGRGLALPAYWEAAAGARVAVVGPPGSGKTTLLEALAGLRVPDHGVAELDGVNAAHVELASLRSQVALVGGAELFAGTIRDNLFASAAAPVDARAALDAVGLSRPLDDLPHGWETPLTPAGGPLSGSQALRLTLARALAARPRLLLLDGTLDGLDREACPDLLAVLFDPAAPWTLVVATADPELAARCDFVVGDLTRPVLLTPSGTEP